MNLTRFEKIVLNVKTIHLILSPLYLLFLVRLGGNIVNLSDFYSYKFIGKLTDFLQLQEFRLNNITVEQLCCGPVLLGSVSVITSPSFPVVFQFAFSDTGWSPSDLWRVYKSLEGSSSPHSLCSRMFGPLLDSHGWGGCWSSSSKEITPAEPVHATYIHTPSLMTGFSSTTATPNTGS